MQFGFQSSKHKVGIIVVVVDCLVFVYCRGEVCTKTTFLSSKLASFKDHGCSKHIKHCSA